MGIRKHIPNTLTLCNLLSGCIGSLFALRGNFNVTLLCVILSGCFDFLDGFSARLLNAYSEIGRELDSLADLVSFGFAPSVTFLSYYQASGHTLGWLCYVPLAITAFSALRLAKFNLDERQSKSFLGMPTPACALLVIPMCVYGVSSNGFIHNLLGSEWFIPVASVALSLLLVSEIPMLSMKQKSARLKAFIVGSVMLVAVCAVFVKCSVSLWMTVIFTYYILLNIGSLRKEVQ
ncbi:MAG: CDP-diacylglycerol--serine O-phosphatidyltransferase [Bacteroidales bacterium]|nr:CDP-diacylglycerol--serine O-phosphatidyltransferase [Candidatus Cacconaster merdequi]